VVASMALAQAMDGCDNAIATREVVFGLAS
jgi:hypothetical protein